AGEPRRKSKQSEMRCSNFVYRTDYRRSGFDNRLFREAAFRLSKRKASRGWNPKRRFRPLQK
uniref:hypothetical protein n=1 Tax=Alistipes shahii TaxID=328814 RepID=UPI003FF10CD4